MNIRPKTAIVLTELRDEGFQVAFIGGNMLRVSLNRPISTMEVEHALWQSGFESSQFSIVGRGEGQVIVEII